MSKALLRDGSTGVGIATWQKWHQWLLLKTGREARGQQQSQVRAHLPSSRVVTTERSWGQMSLLRHG